MYKYIYGGLGILALLGIGINLVNLTNKSSVKGVTVDASGGGPTKGIDWAMGSWYVNGAYNWTGMRQDLDLMKQAGIKIVRFSFGDQTQKTCSSTGFYTQLAAEFDKRGLVGLADISIPNHNTTTATATELSDYQNWLSVMVNCYKGNFKNWEVWNEPNNNAFWNIDYRTTNNTAYAQSVGYYIAYLKVTYNTIKSIDPAANVISGGVTQNWQITLSDGRTIGTMTRFMTEFLKQGGYQYLDSWGFHPYADYDPAKTYLYKGYTGCGTDNIRRIDEYKQYIYSTSIPTHYQGKPLWLTEVGYTQTLSKYPGNTKGSESVKAECLTDTWNKFKAENIMTPIIWFDFSQDSLDGTSANGYSLVPSNKTTSQYQLRGSYYAYKNLWPPVTPTPIPLATPIPTNTPVPTLIPTVTTATLTPTPAAFSSASDNFTRTTVNGWGKANIGGLYTVSDLAGDYWVDGNAGKINIGLLNTQRKAILTQTQLKNLSATVQIKTGKIPSGEVWLSQLLRIGDAGHYRLVAKFINGQVYIQAQKYVNSSGTTVNLGNQLLVSGLNQVAGNYIWMKGQVSGTNPTTIFMKVWDSSQPDPISWQYSVSDNSTSQITQAGNVGLMARTSSTISNLPIVFYFDNWTVKGL